MLTTFVVSASTLISCETTTKEKEKESPKETTKEKQVAKETNKNNSQIRPNTLPPKLLEENFVYDLTNNYYASLDGLSGKTLRDELIKIQGINAKKQKHKYQDLPNFYELHFRDKYYDNDNSIIDVFSEIHGTDPYNYPNYTRGISSTNEEGKGLNREHVIPQSWFRKNKTARSDAHFVWPSDVFVNAERGNVPHDNIVGDPTKTFKSGAKLGKNLLNEIVFEPQDFVKGDIARAYLYFTFTYPSIISVVNLNSIFEKNEPYIPQRYLDIYTKWHKLDTVDEFNIIVNNEIAKFNMGVRNPFVDYPNLLDSLFGENPKPFVNKGVLVSVRK